MNKLNVFIGILLIIFSLFVVNLNIKRYKSFELQRIINADHIFQNPLDQKSLDFINSIDDQYPSLNIFAMPLVSMKAQYLLAKDSIEKAIEYLELGSKNNPYLMFSESRLAEVYLAMTGGQGSLLLSPDTENPEFLAGETKSNIRRINSNRPKLPIIFATKDEIQRHESRLQELDQQSGSTIWRKI